MASRLTMASALVTYPDGQVDDPVTIVVREGRAKVHRKSELVKDVEGVAEVRDERRGRVWAVVFDDGQEWRVERSRSGCVPCGG